MRIDSAKLIYEAKFNFSRSGGKGGQNVNKVETKVELVFNVDNSQLLDAEVKEKLKRKLAGKLDSEGNLHVVSQTERTQLGNRKKAVDKFTAIINHALKKEKKRVKTKKSEAAKQRILESKRKHSEKKRVRKRVEQFE